MRALKGYIEQLMVFLMINGAPHEDLEGKTLFVINLGGAALNVREIKSLQTKSPNETTWDYKN